MGLTNFYKSKKTTAKPTAAAEVVNEKPQVTPYGQEMAMSAAGTPRNFASSRASIAPSTRSSTMVDEIKHEVMVNYLHQQQCGHMWVADGSGQLEGVVLKKYRGEYLACPPELVHSEFGMACQALNVQVSHPSSSEQGIADSQCSVP